MRWAFRVARVAGTEIRIHVTFLLLLALVALGAWQSGGAHGAVRGVVFILLLFGSVLLHEMGHALAARRYGIATPFIILLPIGGIASLQSMPREPRRELVIAVAGPLVNVAIALAIAAALAGIGGDVRLFTAPEGGEIGMAAALMNANVALVLFNLLPAFPMDGGRMLRAVLAMRMDYLAATRIAAGLGQGFALLLGAAGLFVNPLLILIALVVYVGATQEAAAVRMRTLGARLTVSSVMMTDVRALGADTPLRTALELMLRTPQHVFPVVDDSGRVEGILGGADVVAALGRGGRRASPGAPSVAGLMRRDVPSVAADARLDEAVERMAQSRAPALPVTDAAGRLVGMLTPEKVGIAIGLQEGRFQPPAADPAWTPPSAAEGPAPPR